MTVSSNLAAAIETALQLYMDQDPAALQRCSALEGKVIALDFTGLDLRMYFFPGQDGIQVLSQYEGTPDTRLTGTPLGFSRLALGSREDALFQGAVEITGDTETGQQFQDLLVMVDWDWEEHLSRLTGDVVAHQVGSLVNKVSGFLQESRHTLEQDLSEYLREEARLLPTSIEVRHFLDEVDQVRTDADRLSARVERLLKTMSPDT